MWCRRGDSNPSRAPRAGFASLRFGMTGAKDCEKWRQLADFLNTGKKTFLSLSPINLAVSPVMIRSRLPVVRSVLVDELLELFRSDSTLQERLRLFLYDSVLIHRCLQREEMPEAGRAVRRDANRGSPSSGDIGVGFRYSATGKSRRGCFGIQRSESTRHPSG